MHQYVTQNEAAKLVRLKPRTMEAMRLDGTGPKFTKAGRRVIYSLDAIKEWLDKRTFENTSQAAAARCPDSTNKTSYQPSIEEIRAALKTALVEAAAHQAVDPNRVLAVLKMLGLEAA